MIRTIGKDLRIWKENPNHAQLIHDMVLGLLLTLAVIGSWALAFEVGRQWEQYQQGQLNER